MPAKPLLMSYETPDGATWTFEPATQKWTVALDGQKSSSQKYDTLGTKVLKWVNGKRAQPSTASTAPAAAPPLFTFGMAKPFKFENTNEVMSLLTIAIPPQTDEGLTIKTAWDAENELFTIARFRQWSATPNKRGESGWESSNAQRQFLINFEALDEDDQAWWRRLFVARAQVKLANQARQSIGEAWLATKHDATAFYQAPRGYLTRNADVQMIPIERPAPDSSSGVWALPQGCPLAMAGELASTDGWDVQSGTWVKGAVQLGFVADSSVQPTFEVKRVMPNGALEKMWNGSSFTTAIALANAMAQAMDDSTPMVESWTFGSNFESKPSMKLGQWPAKVAIQTAVFVMPDSDSRNGQLWTLAGNTTEPVDVLAKHSPLRPTNGWQQRTSSGTHTTFVPMGPEDALHTIAMEIDTMTRTRVAPVVSESRDEMVQRLQRQTQATIKAAYDLACDGEALSDNPAFMVDRWRDTVLREEARAMKHPDVVAFAQQCASMAERAVLMLADLGHSPSASVSKPSLGARP